MSNVIYIEGKPYEVSGTVRWSDGTKTEMFSKKKESLKRVADGLTRWTHGDIEDKRRNER